jgi:hypothetical protein
MGLFKRALVVMGILGLVLGSVVRWAIGGFQRFVATLGALVLPYFDVLQLLLVLGGILVVMGFYKFVKS